MLHVRQSEQGLVGDATGERPSIVRVESRLKYDAHAKNKGMAPEEAQKRYVEMFLQVSCQIRPRRGMQGGERTGHETGTEPRD